MSIKSASPYGWRRSRRRYHIVTTREALPACTQRTLKDSFHAGSRGCSWSCSRGSRSGHRSGRWGILVPQVVIRQPCTHSGIRSRLPRCGTHDRRDSHTLACPASAALFSPTCNIRLCMASAAAQGGALRSLSRKLHWAAVSAASAGGGPAFFAEVDACLPGGRSICSKRPLCAQQLHSKVVPHVPHILSSPKFVNTNYLLAAEGTSMKCLRSTLSLLLERQTTMLLGKQLLLVLRSEVARTEGLRVLEACWVRSFMPEGPTTEGF